MSRRLLIITLFFMFLFSPAGGGGRVIAGEYDDAKVAFGAFADGLYDFAGAELTQFLINYPESKLAPKAHLVLTLCFLKTGNCLEASREFAKLKKPLSVAALQVDPADLKLHLGDCFLAAGEQAKAIDFFTKVTREYGASDAAIKAAFKLSRIFFASSNFAAANRQIIPLLKIVDSKRIRRLKLDQQTIYWVAAFSYYRLQNYSEALPLLLRISRVADEFSFTLSERQDLYAILVESAWHTGDSGLMTTTVKRWLQIPAADLDSARLTTAVLLTAGQLRADKHLSEIRDELIILTGFSLDPVEKRTVYELLVEIAQADGDQKALKGWLSTLITLIPPSDAHRTAYLETLLLLDYKSRDYRGAVTSGYRLIREQPQFWHQEKLYFPFIIALGHLDKCVEIVKFVPAALPVYATRKTVPCNQRRLALDLLAGSCRVRLGRFSDAVTFYRSLYDHYNDPAVRVKLLASLCNLAGKIPGPKELDDWISREVMGHFSLDRREDEKLLRTAPELVLLVAESLFTAQSYLKVLPSLLWLEKLKLQGRLHERVVFLLAESYYRCGEPAEARARFEVLYAAGSQEFHDLSALRLVTIYEAQGQVNEKPVAPEKLEKLYRDILKRETDPALKIELEHKLDALLVGEK